MEPQFGVVVCRAVGAHAFGQLEAGEYELVSEHNGGMCCGIESQHDIYCKLSFVIFFASAAVLCYNTAPLTGHGPAPPG